MSGSGAPASASGAWESRAWTGPALSSSFLGLCREFHGHAQGGREVVELVGHEWATSSHFLDSFYVYQYAAAGLLAASWVHGMRQDPGRGEALLALLRSGRSAPPVALLRAAGLDPLRAETYAPGFARVRELLALARGLSVR